MGVEKRQAVSQRKWWRRKELGNRIKRFINPSYAHAQQLAKAPQVEYTYRAFQMDYLMYLSPVYVEEC